MHNYIDFVGDVKYFTYSYETQKHLVNIEKMFDYNVGSRKHLNTNVS